MNEITKMVMFSGILWLVLLGLIGHQIVQRSRRTLFWGAIGLLLYGILPSIGYTLDGKNFNNTPMIFIGHIMTIFTTTISSALISLSYQEYREEMK